MKDFNFSLKLSFLILHISNTMNAFEDGQLKSVYHYPHWSDSSHLALLYEGRPFTLHSIQLLTLLLLDVFGQHSELVCNTDTLERTWPWQFQNTWRFSVLYIGILMELSKKWFYYLYNIIYQCLSNLLHKVKGLDNQRLLVTVGERSWSQLKPTLMVCRVIIRTTTKSLSGNH